MAESEQNMKENRNCCKNCVNAEDYTGWESHLCTATGHCIRAEVYNCEHFVDEETYDHRFDY